MHGYCGGNQPLEPWMYRVWLHSCGVCSYDLWWLSLMRAVGRKQKQVLPFKHGTVKPYFFSFPVFGCLDWWFGNLNQALVEDTWKANLQTTNQKVAELCGARNFTYHDSQARKTVCLLCWGCTLLWSNENQLETPHLWTTPHEAKPIGFLKIPLRHAPQTDKKDAIRFLRAKVKKG